MAVASLSGCASHSPTTSIDQFEQGIIVETPAAGVSADELASTVAARFDSAQIDHGLVIGDDRLTLGVSEADAELAHDLLTVPGDFALHPVRERVSQEDLPDCTATDPGAACHADLEETGELLELGPATVTGSGITASTFSLDPGEPTVTLAFDAASSSAVANMTENLACATDQGRMAVLIDGVVTSVPVLALPCGERLEGGEIQLTGGFSEVEARRLAGVMAAPLPADLGVSGLQQLKQ